VNHAFSLARDGDGDLWIVDTLNHRLVERDAKFAVKRVLRPLDQGRPLFRSICELDFDADGDLYVADAAASCVVKLSPDGELIDRIGRPADGPRPLVAPSGVTVTPEGGVLVPDVARNVFVRFDRDGRFLDVIGLPHSRKERVHPVAFAADAAGVVFQVWEQPESTIRSFAPNGVMTDEFGGHGDAPGKLLRPRDAACGPAGLLYVADSRRHDVTVYRADGLLVRVFGRKGGGPADVRYPRAVAVSRDGSVFLGDAGNRRIQVFDRAGAFVRTFASGLDVFRIDVDDEGRVAVHDDAAEALLLFDRDGRELARVLQAGRFDVSGPVFGPDGRMWVLDRDAGRIRSFGPDGGAKDFTADPRLRAGRLLFRGRDGRVRVGFDYGFAVLRGDGTIETFVPGLRRASPAHPLMPASLVALDGAELAVLSRKTGSVHVFAPDGTFRRMLALDSAIVGPWQLAAGPKGGLCVLCPFEGAVFRLVDGRAERIVSGESLRMARAIALDASGGVLLIDDRGRSVRRLDRAGGESGVLRSGDGEESFRRAGALTVAPAGDVLIADERGGDILCFGPDLAFKWRIEQQKLDNRQRLWGGVSALHVDAKGKLYVLSKYDNTVQVFGPDRKHLRNIHLDANGIGALTMPDDLLVHSDGTILIADTGNNRIVRLIPIRD
jgi:sugar lactone lactonase YvrE